MDTLLPHTDETGRLRKIPAVVRVYLTALAFCAVVIVAGGCRSDGPMVALAPDVGPVVAGGQVALLANTSEKDPAGLPQGWAWEVNGVLGGSPFYGQVGPDGVYVAPEVDTTRKFTVRLVRQRPDGRAGEVLAVRQIMVLPRGEARPEGDAS